MNRLVRTAALVLAFLAFFLTAGNAGQAADLKEFLKKYEKTVVFITVYNQQGEKLGSGSGFFINADGDFITNRHVIEKAVTATVETIDGSKYEFDKLLAFKTEYDLALCSLKNARPPHPFLDIAPGYPERGERIVALGNPQGIKFSSSEGIVSGIHTFPNSEFPQISFKGTFIHFTAPVSPGSSGGPVVNEAGQVIGVSTWMIALEHSQNMNFAVPAEAVRDLIASRGGDQPTVAEKPNPAAPLGKPRVGVVVTYGPTLVKEITSEDRRDQITEVVEEAIASKFKAHRFNLKLSKDVNPQFTVFWKTIDPAAKMPTGDEVEKSNLMEFGERLGFDYVVFAAIDLAAVKTASNRYAAGSSVIVELDLRVANVARKAYSYSRVFSLQNSDVSYKIWIFSTANVATPTIEAIKVMMHTFRRDFSAAQTI